MPLIEDIPQLGKLAGELVNKFQPGQVLLIEGPMGAGKTQLVKEMLQHMGIEEGCSPTFALHNQYSNGKIKIDHFDLYRLENAYDLETTGFWESLMDKDSYTFIEWADRINESFLPKNLPIIKIKIEPMANGSRQVSCQGLF